MRSARGFVYYDVWIVLAIIVVAALIVVPSILRAVGKQQLRVAEVATLYRIAAAERTAYARDHRYRDAVDLVLREGVRVASLRGDTAGWTATVTGDSLSHVAVTCGMFVGPPSFAPSSTSMMPGQVACW